MLIRTEDFNDADKVILGTYEGEWKEIETVLEAMPLHLKASDQAGIQGVPIFDPVGTNEYIKQLLKTSWQPSIPIPTEYSLLGTDIDFGKSGILLEVQFSNYPFLLNNLLRSELFFKSAILLNGYPTRLVIIVTKAHMCPASNSTLYFEQAQRQLASLAKYKVFDVPIRLVGLYEQENTTVEVQWTQYKNPRYSRTVIIRERRRCNITRRSPRSRCDFKLVD